MEFRDLTFSYQAKEPFIKKISGIIPKGKITSIIGPNGSGKSTLLSLLVRNQEMESGSILLHNKDLYSYNAKQLAKEIAIVYQSNQTTDDMRVEDLIRFGRLPHKSIWKKDSKEDEEAIDWAIKCMQLEKYRASFLDELSGGQRQRVWIAMSLAQKSDVLFLDEPTTYLDIYHQIELLQLISRLNETYNITIIMVLHDINQAYRYSDQVILMKDGEIVMNGSPNKVITAATIKEIYAVNIAVNQQEESGDSYIVPLGI
ncbi:ABC transporter ATP-binding protein [Bacillus sp. B1-b2]|uniref:ABC transporter ATP-binding protein n=1 Tax=Bacillus sp. B1-b2 TaxID=2653201 RepID=UPI0012628322|nr:ABC transporter ATP-binding protein [Bacillus sp. B1-b2]KAB7665627.1 ABC transporter ATP-binding protein [Bacillus sp. B1-b2]